MNGRTSISALLTGAILLSVSTAWGGTVALWRFEEGTAGANPPTGVDVIVDSSGSGNDLRTVQTPTYSSDVPVATVGGAPNTLSFDFDSTPFDDLFTSGKPINSLPLGAWTIEASVKVDALGQYHGIVGKDGQPTASPLAPVQMKLRGNNNRFQIETVQSDATGRSVLSDFTAATGTWYHVAATNDGSIMRLYVDQLDGNGYVLQGATKVNEALVPSSNTWTVGRGHFNSTNTDGTDGHIDEVRVSDSALAPSQFLHAVAGTQPANGIVGFWDFNDSANVGKARVGQDLTPQDNAAYSAGGQHKGAVTLDGAGDMLDHPGAGLPADLPLGDQSYTISAWIQPTAGGNRGIVGWGNYGTSGQVNATRIAGTTDLVNYGWGGANDIQRGTGATLTDGNWHHVAAVYDAATGEKRLYYNGNQIGAEMPVPDLNVQGANFAVGRSCPTCGGGEFFQGQIDDVAVSNQALSQPIIGSIAAGASPVNAPLVSLWRFDDRSNLGVDSSALGNDLTAQNGAAFSGAGKYGGAASLDGADDMLDMGGAFPHGVPTGDRAYTIAAWLKPDAAGDRGIVGWGDYGTGNEVTALRLLGSNSFRHYWWSNDRDSDAGTLGIDLLDGDWHHVAVTYDGGTRSIWLDGLFLDSDNPSGHNAAASNFAVGRTCPFCGGGEFFDGLLDDVAIFNLALTEDQIQTVMGGDFTAFGASAVPEPSSLLLAVLALIGSAALGRRWRRRYNSR